MKPLRRISGVVTFFGRFAIRQSRWSGSLLPLFIGAGAIVAPTLKLAVGALNLSGSNDVDFLSLTNIGTAGVARTFMDADGFALGVPETSVDFQPADFSTLQLTALAGTVIFRPEQTLALTVGASFNDEIFVSGGVIINTQLALNVGGGSPIPFGTEFVLIANDGTDAISGTFNGLPEGAYVPDFSPLATISYRGGDGNDVTITTLVPLNVTIVTGGKSATFTDVDGDIVTVKTTAGTFTPASFGGIQKGVIGGGQLQKLTLDATFAGASITVTAKPSILGGNGFVNVGEIDADGTDLGKVTIGGELQDLEVGDSTAARIALGSLTVQSLGTLGGTAPSGDEINGKHGLGKITVKTDIRATDIYSNNPTGNLASLTVGGSVTKSTIQSAAGIGTITIGGSFRDNGRIQAVNRIGSISIGGDLNDTQVEIFAKSTLAGKGPDNAIGKLTIGGNFETTNVTIGENNNADAGIGAISVGRAWIASSILASTTAGTDGFTGTGDDSRVTIGIDETGRFSTIASLIIKGQAFGSTASGDHFGIVAEQIGKVKIGTISYAFKPVTKESFAAAPTRPGKGAFPFDKFDFYIRELV